MPESKRFAPSSHNWTFWLFNLTAIGLLMIYGTLVCREFLADRAAGTLAKPNLQRAVALVSWNSEHYHRLGLVEMYVEHDPDAAIQSLERAARVDPNESLNWLDLATAYHIKGDGQGERRALTQAADAEPRNPDIAWRVASFFLVNDELAPALHELGVVYQHDPEHRPDVLNLCWRVTQDVSLIIREIAPNDSALQLQFLQFLLDHRQFSAADQVWQSVEGTHQPFRVTLAMPYFDSLIQRAKVDELVQAWSYVTRIDPDLNAYKQTDNLIVNADFEHEILQGGLDWRFSPTAGAAVSLDSGGANRGQRSLGIVFNGQPPDIGLSQYIPVASNTHYELSVKFRTEGLASASAPRLELLDAFDHRRVALSDELTSSPSWQTMKASFMTGAASRLLVLKVIREPADRLIEGKLWLDDFDLVEK